MKIALKDWQALVLDQQAGQESPAPQLGARCPPGDLWPHSTQEAQTPSPLDPVNWMLWPPCPCLAGIHQRSWLLGHLANSMSVWVMSAHTPMSCLERLSKQTHGLSFSVVRSGCCYHDSRQDGCVPIWERVSVSSDSVWPPR